MKKGKRNKTLEYVRNLHEVGRMLHRNVREYEKKNPNFALAALRYFDSLSGLGYLSTTPRQSSYHHADKWEAKLDFYINKLKL